MLRRSTRLARARFEWAALPTDVQVYLLEYLAEEGCAFLFYMLAVSASVRRMAVTSLQRLTTVPPFIYDEKTQARYDKAMMRLLVMSSRMGTWCNLTALRLGVVSDAYTLLAFCEGSGFKSVQELCISVESASSLAYLVKELPALTNLEIAWDPEPGATFPELAPAPNLVSLILHLEPDDTPNCTLLLALASLTNLETLVLRISSFDLDEPHGQLDFPTWPRLKRLHLDCDILTDQHLQALLTRHPHVCSLSLYGTDRIAGLGLLANQSVTQLSLVNCMGLTSDALAAIEGTMPLKQLAVTYFDWTAEDCAFTLDALVSFITSFPKLEALQLDTFQQPSYGAEGSGHFSAEMLARIERSCPSIRQVLVAKDNDCLLDCLRTHAETLPRLSAAVAKVPSGDSVPWSYEAWQASSHVPPGRDW